MVEGVRVIEPWRPDTTKPNGQPRRCLDVSRAERAFGFRARTGFLEGLTRTVAWYRERRAAGGPTAGTGKDR
jgi:nucleoside-diphosphate-sugar epimerase